MFLILAVTNGLEWAAPTVPSEAQEWMPRDTETFLDGLMEILGKVIPKIYPALTEVSGVCAALLGIALLVSLVSNLHGPSARSADLTGTVAVGLILLRATGSLIALGADTVVRISDYGKLLLPVMAAAMAGSGGVNGSAALYLGTAFFDSVLTAVATALLIPMVYVFLALAVVNSALGENLLKQLKDFVKWLMTWTLKITLYIFTGYMGITGVISGSADAAALKAAKLTISGIVPVVGGILSDASEAVLVSADLVRNAAGIYGLLAVIALWVGPFLQIGVQYLMLKITSGICGIFGTKAMTGLIGDFTTAMGLLLAITAAMCLIFMISTVCFMKGVG